MLELVIYSPAPVSNMLHELNQDLGRAINRRAGTTTARVIPIPLPDSINAIGRLPEAVRRHHLPIVTSVDFLPAVEMKGPSWHAYNRANRDLKLVTALYDVAFGITVFDPSIRSPAGLRGRKVGAPPRPSSVRVLTEALLRDGWGILEAVELVDLRPDEVEAAVASGSIHATSWNLLHRAPEAFVPLLPALLTRRTVNWLDVSDGCLAAINAANPFKIDGIPVPAGERSMTLLSFKQGLAAWDSTEDSLVQFLLQCLEDRGAGYGGLPASPSAMVSWPSLARAQMHPGALRFFAERGIVVR